MGHQCHQEDARLAGLKWGFTMEYKEELSMTYHNFEGMPLVLEVADTADTLAIGRNKAYELVNSEQSGSFWRNL